MDSDNKSDSLKGKSEKSDVFVYCDQYDESATKVIVEELKARGLSVTFDSAIGDYTGGKPKGMIEVDQSFDSVKATAQITNSKLTLIVLSRVALYSEWVREMIRFSINHKKYLPVLIDDIELPLGLVNYSTPKLTNWTRGKPHAGFDTIVKRVNSGLGPMKQGSDILPEQDDVRITADTVITSKERSNESIDSQSEDTKSKTENKTVSFISCDIYANVYDLDRSGPIIEVLRSRGWRVWDGKSNLPHGIHYPTADIQAYASARCVITFWTENAAANGNIVKRAGQRPADKLNLSVKMDYTDIPESLLGPVSFDFSDYQPGKVYAGIDRLIKAISNIPKTGTASDQKETLSYRREFLTLLNNKAKTDSESALPPWTPRKDGFILLVSGGPSLEVLESVCTEQLYNKCFVVRGRMKMWNNLFDSLFNFEIDVIGTFAGKESSKSIVSVFPSRESVTSLFSRFRLPSPLDQLQDGDPPSLFLTQINTQIEKHLNPGERLILLLEIQDFPTSPMPEDLYGLGLIERYGIKVPERLGIVISGIPKHITEGPLPKDFFGLSIPSDRVAEKHSLPWSNDNPTGDDTLNIKQEITAIADAIALSKMEPPLVVGVLGGWGTGKSFVLDLIKRRLIEIRCSEVKNRDENLYVGHPYLIEFNAWTYAKSNLWASLMHDIFTQLNNQLTVEQALNNKTEKSALSQNIKSRMIYEVEADFIRPFLEKEISSEAIGKWFNESGEGRTLWSHLSELHLKDIQELAEVEDELRAKTARLKVRESQFKLIIERRVKKRVEEKVWRTVATDSGWNVVGDLQAHFAERFKSEGIDWNPTYRSLLLESSGWKDIWSDFTKKPGWLWLIGLPILLIAISQLVSNDLDTLLNLGWMDDFFKTIAPIVTVFIGIMTKIIKWSEKIRRFVSEAKTRSKKVAEEVASTEEPEIVRELAKRLGLTRREGETRQLRNHAKELSERIGPMAEFTSVLDFVGSRLNDKDYENELGLLHRVQKDLKSLNSAISLKVDTIYDPHLAKKKALFPRGDSRVYLIIDDIDRCPPDRVVEILEAAQLLVKSNLFVVILAMDLRYVTRALEKHYEDILVHDGEPSGLDYIEKIVQIPYRVRPMHPNSVGGYLESQMGDLVRDEPDVTPQHDPVPKRDNTPDPDDDPKRDGAPDGGTAKSTQSNKVESAKFDSLPPKAMQFTTEEHEALEDLCQRIDVTPRSAKRLVNVFKVMKIVWYRRKEDPKQEKKKSILLLLALSASYPGVMRYVLKDIGQSVRSDEPSATIADVFTKCKAKLKKKNEHSHDCEEIAGILGSKNLTSAKFKLSGFEIGDIHLVSSFSFVGEVDNSK